MKQFKKPKEKILVYFLKNQRAIPEKTYSAKRKRRVSQLKKSRLGLKSKSFSKISLNLKSQVKKFDLFPKSLRSSDARRLQTLRVKNQKIMNKNIQTNLFLTRMGLQSKVRSTLTWAAMSILRLRKRKLWKEGTLNYKEVNPCIINVYSSNRISETSMP